MRTSWPIWKTFWKFTSVLGWEISGGVHGRAAAAVDWRNSPADPARRGRVERYDYEYERCGTAALFLFVQPLAAWRKVSVREQRTKVDWAREIQQLLEEDFPDAARVILVCDNLNTHKAGSLYEAFEPQKARRLAERLRIHYTPKHGSWLNVAEIELSALSRQCLGSSHPNSPATHPPHPGVVGRSQSNANRSRLAV